ncbi:MAG TPA: DUF3106 domain-containing protein [Candidatus Sulfotelmatobacter sp.]|nr:DUF3106 domain-containing protein [Candidatus Sulfotelmatobacter sp.]
MPPPTPPVMFSPVDYFRKLLAMSPQQLQIALAKKSPKVRERILAKVNEYAAMDAGERELRLQATELRWYLEPLLQASPDRRAAQLALVPADIRDLVQSRLTEWVILPPQLQQEFLDNEHIAGYFAGLSTTNSSSDVPAPSGAEQSRWNACSQSERQAMIAQFISFFNLSTAEKQKALGELTGIEARQMERTMQTFDKMPMRQRIQCVRAFGKFSNMSSEERAEFLKNAQLWSKMTPSERQAWRDLVAHVPQWPPIPTAAIMPPIPPAITPHVPPLTPQNIRTIAATNHS